VIELVDLAQREALRGHLAERGIIAGIHYPFGVHQQPAYGPWIRKGPMAVTERLADTVLSLPLYPELSDPDHERVCLAQRGFFNAWR
jgi:dTDP-4-amino-4,6-dideoxygalactose transaminase